MTNTSTNQQEVMNDEGCCLSEKRMMKMNRSIYMFIIVLSLITAPKSLAQISPNNIKDIKQHGNKSINPDTVFTRYPQKDLPGVFAGIFHKKKNTTPKKDTITSKPTFSGLPAAGYTLVSKFAVTVTGNAAFRTGSSAQISTITSYVSYTQNKQFLLPIESDIWTKGNKYNLVGDFRFYSYPQSTFGLGSNSGIKNEDPMDYLYFRFYETVLRHVKGHFYAGAGYIIDYHSNITHHGPLNGAKSDYEAYGPQSKTVASGITLNALFENRDNPIYPGKGYYGSIQYRNNTQLLGSTSSWTSLIVDLRTYFKLPANSDNVLAFWSYDWVGLTGKPGYLDLPSNQWDAYSSTGRGYIQGRFRGSKEVYAETEYRFKITRNGLFGGVLFLNGQSYSAAPGTKLQSIQPGFGTGLRIKINKTSKTNIAFDYGFGRQGSGGLFINIGEVF